jgi:hypothetical protein
MRKSEVESSGMVFILIFVKVHEVVQKLVVNRHTDMNVP